MTSESPPKRGTLGITTAVVAMIGIVIVIGAVLLLSGDDDEPGNETPPDETPSQSGPFSFSGTLNYDMPTPSPAVENHQFSFDEETEVIVTFAISPVWEDCGFWWRVDAADSDFFYFGDHHLNTDAVEDTVALPSGSFELQVGVSFEDVSEQTCSGTADYQVEVTSQ